MEEEKVKIPNDDEMRQIIIEIKKKTKQLIRKKKEQTQYTFKFSDITFSNLYNCLINIDVCIIKCMCLILLLIIVIIITEVIKK